MANLTDLAEKVSSVTGISVVAGDYRGFLSKELTLSSSIAVVRPGHGYHIEITNPKEEMLVFPVVTSSKYEFSSTDDSNEKRRYFLQFDVNLQRRNLIALVKRCIDTYSSEYKYEKRHYEDALIRLTASDDPTVHTFAHCTFQLRNSGQRQFEIGTANDGQDFITLRQCLLPNDYIVFFQREAASYDVYGLPKEDMIGQSWVGWEAGEPGRQVVPSDRITSLPEDAVEHVGGGSSDIGSVTEQKIAEVVSVCERYGDRSIIALAGVPGTGKSHIASIAAARMAGHRARIREIQFHASFTYEEFIEGMRIGPGGTVVVEPGIFLELNTRAWQEPGKRFVLLIEELTRTNLASVLGELLTYIEHRDREFLTLYKRKPVRVAPNLTILATYNPLDRSAIDMDAALLRRLRIVSFPPDRNQLSEMLSRNSLSTELVNALQGLFDACQVKPDYETWMPFGHGIFAGIRNESPDLYDLWNERIKHLLYRPGMMPHKFAALIEEYYPWKDSTYELPKSATSDPLPSVLELESSLPLSTDEQIQ